jgi:BTB/POZ domain-containing protein KCTD9
MTNPLPPKSELRASFKRVYDGPDRLQREYDLVKESETLGMELETYRRLYELRGEMSVMRYPESSWFWGIGEWGKYIFKLPKDRILPLSWKAATKIIKNAGVLAAIPLVFGAVKYILEEPKRDKQARYEAWQIINSAKGQRSEAGRIEALQYLVKQNVNLQGLIVTDTFINGVKLPNAKLSDANFNKTALKLADLKDADLKDAYLNEAELNSAELNNANLAGAKLVGAKLFYTNLSGANLDGANLSGAELGNANLSGANLRSTDLSGSDLGNVNLGGADLSGADLSHVIIAGADLRSAKLNRAKNIDLEEIKTANNWQAACYDPDLRQKLKLPQNTECDRKSDL